MGGKDPHLHVSSPSLSLFTLALFSGLFFVGYWVGPSISYCIVFCIDYFWPGDEEPVREHPGQLVVTIQPLKGAQ